MSPLGRRALVVLCATALSFSSLLSAQDPVPVAVPALGTPSVIPHDGVPDILTGTASLAARAKLFSGAPGHPLLAQGAPFGEAFPGGLRVASGDVTGDGVGDAIVAMGPGVIAGPGGTSFGGLIRIYNGFDASLVAEGFPFGPTSIGGVWVAMGDVNDDGRDDLIAAEGTGAHVRVYSLAGAGALLADLTPYGGGFTGGVRVAAGDVNGDGRADVITGPASGVGTVKVFSGGTTPIGEFFTFDPGFAGGVFVAAGDVNGDGRADIVASTGSGQAHVKVFDAATGALLHNLGPLPASSVSVAAADVNADGKADIIGGIGPGGPPIVGIIDGATGTLLASFLVEGAAFTGGVIVAARPNLGIQFTSADEATFTTGMAGTFTVTTSAAPPVTTITQTGTLPTGVTFTDNHDGTATLSGTVPVGSGGTFTLTFAAQNGVSPPAQQTFTLRVHGPPQITSANATTFNVGAAGTFNVTTTGFPAPTLTRSGTLPAGVTFTDNGNGTATLAGTPQTGSGGTYPLTITASNGVGSPATQAFTLTVDSAPAFTSASAAALVVGTAGSFAITTTGDPAVSTITQTGALPAGVTFTDNGNGTASLVGTPAAGTQGTYPLVLTASNGVGANAVQSFTLTVNLGPTITSAATTTFVVGVAGTFTVTTAGSPVPTLSTTGTLPTGVTFTDNGNGTATLAGTPIAGTGGVHSFTIEAANGLGSPATQAFSLVVNEAPFITSAGATTFTVGAAGTFTVTTSGYPTASLGIGGVSLPTGVNFSDNGNGTATLAGTPAAGTGGTYALFMTAMNSVGASAPQSFTLTVNEAPVFSSATSTSFVVGTPGTFDVITTGFPTATLNTASPLPDGVTFVDDGDGTATLSGTPDPGSAGPYALELVATNGVSAPVTQTFTLNVNQTPAIISPAATAFAVGVPGTFDVVATGFPAPTLTRGGAALPAGVTFVENGDGTGTLAGTPETGTGGTYNLTFQATNSAGSSPTQNFVLSVSIPPQITSADNATFTAGAVSSFTVTATGTPTPTVSQTGALPAGITFNTGTSTFEGTPTATGTFAAIQLTASNGAIPDAVQNFTLNVICPVITVTSIPPTVPNGVFGVLYAGAQFNQSGGGAGTWSATGLPPGLGVDPTTGALAGTPSNTGVFNGTVTYTNSASCQGSTNVSITIAPNAVGDSYDAGIGNTQMVVAGHSAPSTPFVAFVSTVLANDGGPAGTLAVTPVTNAATTAGGLITIDALGRLTYTPQAGDIGVDSFVYTVTSNGVSAQATIALGIGTERVWYVNGAAGAGSGLSNSPLNSFATINAAGGSGDADDAGDYIYVYPGTYASGFEAEGGQTLWGAGTTFNPVAGLTISAAAKPQLQGTVNIAGDNVAISSIDIATNGTTGMTNTGLRFGLTIKNDVTVAATAASAVVFNDVSSTPGGAPNFGINFRSLSSSGAAKGISLTNVNAASGSFLVTGADGGDLDTIPDLGSGGAISNVTARGVEMINVSRAVSLNGMIFTNAGSTDGTASTNCSSVLTGDNTLCNAAIHLVNVGNGGSVGLSGILVDGGAQVGINTNGVTNLTMNAVEVQNVGTDSHESGVMLQNAFGVGSVTNSSFHNNSARQFHLANSSGTLVFTLTGSTFQNSFAPNGSQGLLVEGYGASTTMTVLAGVSGNGNAFNNLFSNAWQIAAGNDATLTVSLVDSTVTNTNGIVSQASLSSNVVTTIQNNTFVAGPNTGAGAISLKTDGGGSMTANVIGNTIGQAGVPGSGTACVSCTGMFINPRGTGSFTMNVIGNTIQNVNGTAIVVGQGEAVTQSVNAVFTGNLIRQPGPNATTDSVAVDIRNGVTSGPPADAGCQAMTFGGTLNPGAWPSQTPNAMNQILGTWNSAFGEADIFMWRRFSTTINLPGLSGNEAAWLTARNAFDGTPAVTTTGTPFGSLASCPP